VATYEVLTDTDGRLSAAIEVASDSELIFNSKQPLLAQFSVSGRASEFSSDRDFKVFAKPMLEIVNACIVANSNPKKTRFTYRNYNENSLEVAVPLTALNSTLYRNPAADTDDLHINSFTYDQGSSIIPQQDSVNLRDGALIMAPGQGELTVNYEPSFGGLTWRLIGQNATVNESSLQCLENRGPTCARIPDSQLRRIIAETRISITGTLKYAARVWSRGRSPYLRSSATALKKITLNVKRLSPLYICEQGATLNSDCRRTQFPSVLLSKIHGGIFRVKSNVNKKSFDKMRNSYQRRFNSFIKSNFPDEVVKCPQQ
jgi:hypothetical protein